MHKYWLVADAILLARMAVNIGIMSQDQPVVAAPAQPDPRREGGTRNRPRPNFNPEEGLTRATRTNNQIFERNAIHWSCHLFPTKKDAMDFIEEMTRADPLTKLTLLESVAYFEVPPVAPVMKQWNENGELSAG